MLQYLLDCTLIWGITAVFFHLKFGQLKHFNVNRGILLASLLIAPTLPLLRNLELGMNKSDAIFTAIVPTLEINTGSEIATNSSVLMTSFLTALLLCYIIGFAFYSISILKQLKLIRHLNSTGHRMTHSNFTVLVSDKVNQPFSFGSSIYFNEDEWNSTDRQLILDHEIEHVKKRHSIDVIIAEIINTIFWFHPMVYIIKSYLKQTHEFQADHAVLETADIKNYGQILLRQSLSGNQVALAHSFFHSYIKKRIQMMYLKQSGRKSLATYFLMIPLMAILVFNFACTQSDAENDLTTDSGENLESLENDQVFKEVDELPLFATCTDEQKENSLKPLQCSNAQLMSFIGSNLVYPTDTKNQKIEGRVIVKFVVDANGDLTNVEIAKDIGAGCGDAVLEVFNKMVSDGHKWIPGKKGEKNVNTELVLPVTFQMP